MKQILIILGLFASVSTFAQSPRIKLNQITKDSLTGSVLISSPSDSGMVYSRDFYVAYGADTVLILYGDTISGGGGLSSVLSDGVTITGDGTSGNELKVDTATVIATKGDLSDYVTIAGTQTITGAKTFTSALTQSGGDVNFDSGTLFVDADLDRVGIGTTNLTNELNISSSTNAVLRLNSGITNGNVYLTNSADPNGDRASLLVNAYNDGINWIRTFNDDPIWAFQMRTYEDDFVVLRSDTGSVVSFSVLFQIQKDGGIFAPSLGSGSAAQSVYYDTGTDEIFYVSSSIRYKENVEDLPIGLNDLLKLRPATYKYKSNGNKDYGFIAEEVYDAGLEEFVTFNEDGQIEGLKDNYFTVLSIKAIQEQQAMIESQATEIEQLKSQIQLILTEIEQIKNN